MIVDKRKYSSRQNLGSVRGKHGERCIYSPAFIFNFFMMLAPDLRAGYLLISTCLHDGITREASFPFPLIYLIYQETRTGIKPWKIALSFYDIDAVQRAWDGGRVVMF